MENANGYIAKLGTGKKAYCMELVPTPARRSMYPLSIMVGRKISQPQWASPDRVSLLLESFPIEAMLRRRRKFEIEILDQDGVLDVGEWVGLSGFLDRLCDW